MCHIDVVSQMVLKLICFCIFFLSPCFSVFISVLSTSITEFSADADGGDGGSGLCGEGQPDFRSILSYGVQEP